MKKPEILVPAGDPEKLKFALAYGADAVYAGGSEFGLRAYAGNLNQDEMSCAVQYTHKLNRKLYIAVNIFAREQDFRDLSKYLKFLGDIGVDGIIVSDPGVLAVARETVPDLALHLSTQANCTNSHSANFWMAQGVRRIVLARELSLGEIREIRSRFAGELEIFVHGAMCMSYSGRCLLSNYLTGRDANKGECTHPCRWGYALVEEKRPGRYFPLEEDARGSYILNSHDLCLLPYLPLLRDIGLDSLKIEGRMKSVNYVASSAKVYREALDVLWEQGETEFMRKLPGWFAEMDKVSHREYSSGFLLGNPGKESHNIESSAYIREYSFVGRALAEEEFRPLKKSESGPPGLSGMQNEAGCWIEQRNNFKVGERLEVLSPHGDPWTFKVTGLKDEYGEKVTVARHPQQILWLDTPRKLQPFSILRKERRQECEQLVRAKLARPDIQLLVKFVEGMGHLGVVTTIDRQQGEVLIQTTKDCWPELKELISNLPLQVDLMND